MEIIKNTTGANIALIECDVTGRVNKYYFECSPKHLSQVARKTSTDLDALYIAEDRYKMALKLKRKRQFTRYIDHQNSLLV